MSILQKYLKKIGVNSYDELNSDEKNTSKEWEKDLSGRKLTDEDVIKWLETELDMAVCRLTDIDLKKEDEIFRKVEVRFIKKILNFINSPKVAKEFAERGINDLIEKI